MSRYYFCKYDHDDPTTLLLGGPYPQCLKMPKNGTWYLALCDEDVKQIALDYVRYQHTDKDTDFPEPFYSKIKEFPGKPTNPPVRVLTEGVDKIYDDAFNKHMHTFAFRMQDWEEEKVQSMLMYKAVIEDDADAAVALLERRSHSPDERWKTIIALYPRTQTVKPQ